MGACEYRSSEISSQVPWLFIYFMRFLSPHFQSRLAVNSVTSGDFSRPLKIAAFLNEVDSGFRLLNLKNDSLRKRYDGLKYDVKKVEEVVYDISIRGLQQKNEQAAAAANTEG